MKQVCSAEKSKTNAKVGRFPATLSLIATQMGSPFVNFAQSPKWVSPLNALTTKRAVVSCPLLTMQFESGTRVRGGKTRHSEKKSSRPFSQFLVIGQPGDWCTAGTGTDSTSRRDKRVEATVDMAMESRRVKVHAARAVAGEHPTMRCWE